MPWITRGKLFYCRPTRGHNRKGNWRMKASFHIFTCIPQIARVFSGLSCFLLLGLAACFSAMAATSQNPAWRKVEFEAAHPAREGFLLSFNVDEEKCRNAYGKKWREKCAATPGMPGREEKNIHLAPAVAGAWRWVDGNRLRFIPVSEKSIKPQTDFALDLSGLYMPSSVILNTKKASLKTPALAAQLISGDFMTDPSSQGRHRLTAVFTFNYPVPAGFEPKLICGSDIRFGKPELVWNVQKNSLHAAWPVLKMPEQSTRATIFLPGHGRIENNNGEYNVYPASSKSGGSGFVRPVPGRADIFRIKNAEIRKNVDGDLNREFVLRLETTLLAEPRKALENISVWELPEKNSPAATRPCDWSLAPAISRENLAKSRQLSPVNMETGSVPRSSFSFAVPAKKGRYLLVRIDPAFAAASGETLGQPWFSILQAPDSQPDLGFLQPGNILPLRGDGRIGIYSTDLQKISWRLEKIREPFLALYSGMVAEPFAQDGEDGPANYEALSVVEEGLLELPASAEGQAQFSTLAPDGLLGSAVAAKGPCRLTLEGINKDGVAARASRIIVPTDFYLIVKKGAGDNLHCLVGEISSGKPACGVELEVLGANGLPVARGNTDRAGHAVLTVSQALKRERKPVALLARRDNDMAWLPLLDKTRKLDYSAFSVGGRHVSQNGLNVYAFGQRGVYRPGESLFFGVIARQGDFAALPRDLPLFAEIVNPAGVTVWEKIFQAGENGFSDLEWQSPETAPSGKYIFNVRQAKDGDILASDTCRIENFMPESLRARLKVPPIKGWLCTSGDGKAILEAELRNLYGTPAAGSRVKTSLRAAPATFSFPVFGDYVFGDANPMLGEGQAFQLPEQVAGKDGKAILEAPLDRFGDVSGRLIALCEGFEAGGGHAAGAGASFLFSPMKKILGYRLGKNLANPEFILKDASASLDFLALHPSLEPVAWKDLRLLLHRRTYAASLISDGRGGYRYDDVPISELVKSQNFDLPAKGASIPLDTSETGEFLLVVEDAAGKKVARFPYSVAGDEPRLPEAGLAASKMRLNLDKAEYARGEKIACSLTLPYPASGVIAIEREGVENFVWFQAKAGKSVQKIAIPDNFAGKGYVTVTAMRDAASGAIYMEPLSFAAMPFTAAVAERAIEPEITAPASIAPGGILEVEVGLEKPGLLVLSAVDEGVLLLDNFQKPDPLKALLEDRGLDVITLQTLDLLMPDSGRISRRLSPFGGGMGDGAFGARFQNPYRRRQEPPPVFWSGTRKCDGKKLKIAIPIPEYYVGNLKITAVAVGEEGCGSAQRDVKVTAPLVLKPHFPLAVAPGDVFEGSLVLENTGKSPRSGKIAATLPKGLRAVGELPSEYEIAAGETVILPMRFEVLERLGEARLVFEAASDDVRREASLSIRPGSPWRQSVRAGRASEDITIEGMRQLFPDKAKSVLVVDASPFPLLEAFGAYLETYPHGCAEQLISRAFGQLLLDDPAKNEAEGKLRRKVLSIIRERAGYGGLSAWPGGEKDFLLTAYGLDYLVSLAERGFSNNPDLLEMLANALENGCVLEDGSLDGARKTAYAIWVLTRAGRITTRLLENLEHDLDDRGLPWKNDVVAALILGSKREMGMYTPVPPLPACTVEASWLDDYVQQALYIAILARHFPESLTDGLRNDFYDATIMKLNYNAHATFSSAQGLRALRLVEKSLAPGLAGLSVRCAGNGVADGEWLDASTWEGPACSALRLTGVSAPLFWQMRQEGYDRLPNVLREERGLRIAKRFLDENGEPLARVRQGDLVTISITASSSDGERRDCVISDLLPGGLEMIFPAGGADAPLLEKCGFLDRQEDRMLIFAALDSQEKVFEWKARAVCNGEFTAPPVYAEDIANRGVYGNSASGRLEVFAE